LNKHTAIAEFIYISDKKIDYISLQVTVIKCIRYSHT